jgi:nitrate reductase assembly molybdenum cofactor insertion protein NarJ
MTRLSSDASEVLLLSTLTAYPDDAFPESVRTLLEDPGVGVPGSLRTQLEALLGDFHRLDDLRSEYLDLFEREGPKNPVYETEYARDRVLGKSQELADLAGFYKAFGLELGQGDRREMADHVSVELEFYAVLLAKSELLEARHDDEGVRVVAGARRRFLEAHLGRFAGAIVERPGVAASPFYSAVFAWCRDRMAAECRRTGAAPEPVRWNGPSPEPDEVKCGTSCPVPPGQLKQGDR